jgi:hypothetical protein
MPRAVRVAAEIHQVHVGDRLVGPVDAAEPGCWQMPIPTTRH